MKKQDFLKAVRQNGEKFRADNIIVSTETAQLRGKGFIEIASGRLRIEITPERSLLLPHNHFIFAELDSGGDEQNLKLVFTTHEISVRGHHLRRIETVLQRLELSLLAKLPNNQRKLITEGQPVILEIVVTEAKSQESPPPNGSK
jgi:hypothetical protein